jgi:hypothetical protein
LACASPAGAGITHCAARIKISILSFRPHLLIDSPIFYIETHKLYYLPLQISRTLLSLTTMPSTHESYFTRYLVALCLLITTTITVLLCLGNAFSWTITSTYDLVVTYRASIQIVVQVLSAILGGLHVFTLTTLVNFRTRLLLSSHQPISLDVLNWWNKLCNRSFPGLGLSGLLFFALLVFWGL